MCVYTRTNSISKPKPGEMGVTTSAHVLTPRKVSSNVKICKYIQPFRTYNKFAASNFEHISIRNIVEYSGRTLASFIIPHVTL